MERIAGIKRLAMGSLEVGGLESVFGDRRPGRPEVSNGSFAFSFAPVSANVVLGRNLSIPVERDERRGCTETLRIAEACLAPGGIEGKKRRRCAVSCKANRGRREGGLPCGKACAPHTVSGDGRVGPKPA